MMEPMFLLLLAAVSVFAAPEDKDLVQYRDLREVNRIIIGGFPAGIEEFPFLVAVDAVYEKFQENENTLPNQIKYHPIGCGGAIITKDWVLTAAHCVLKGVLKVNARGGSNYNLEGGVVRQGTKIVRHSTPSHDIALFKVGKPWPMNGVTISLARLPRQDDPIPVGSPATIMGWGAIDEERTTPEMLMKQEVVVISPAWCNASWWYRTKIEIDEEMMCTLFEPMKQPSGVWQGGTGGPVVVNGEVVGITTWLNYDIYLPDVHTRVSSYIDWIEDTVGPLPRTKW